MPQLNPAPWFFILLLSWTTMLILFKMKLLNATPTNTPTTQELPTHYATPWSWPWA